MNKPYLSPAAALLAVTLAACGGGGSDEGSASVNEAPARQSAASPMPDGAMSSAAAFTAYLMTLKPDNTGEPMNVSAWKPPVSNTAEPVDVR